MLGKHEDEDEDGDYDVGLTCAPQNKKQSPCCSVICSPTVPIDKSCTNLGFALG